MLTVLLFGSYIANAKQDGNACLTRPQQGDACRNDFVFIAEKKRRKTDWRRHFSSVVICETGRVKPVCVILAFELFEDLKCRALLASEVIKRF